MPTRNTMLLIAGCLFGAALASSLQSSGVLADNPAPPKLPEFTREREQTALAFVAQHHPDLSGVLQMLEQANRPQYEQAIREIVDTCQRFTLLKAKDEVLYGLLLEGWKTQSRAEVLAARLAIGEAEDPALEAELRELIARKIDLERKAVAHNRERTQKMLEGLDKQLEWYKENRTSLIERRLKALTNSGKRAAKPEQKPGAADGQPRK